jgi:protein-S-isoprenylcysteine O-methyltransferase Ste14
VRAAGDPDILVVVLLVRLRVLKGHGVGYAGILLAMIGSAIAVSVWWLIAVPLIGGYFIYSAFVEERNMTRLFPSAYPEYQHSTNMLIPFIF